MKSLLICLVTLSWLAVYPSVSAQQKEKPLTNKDVIKLIEAGMEESVIISKIQTSKVEFDTSSDALIELKKKGASEKVRNAMLDPKGDSGRGNPKDAVNPGMPVAGPGHMGVFLVEGDKRVLMKKGGYFKVSFRYFYSKGKIKFDGPHASYRIANRSPIFEVRIPADVKASENILLIKPRVEKDEREFEAARFDMAGAHKGKIKTVDIKIDHVNVQEGFGSQFAVYLVRPTQPISPGEYVLTVGDANVFNWQVANHYDFGVDATAK